MKLKLIILVALLFSINGIAQQAINYKALIKDNLGNVVANQSVTIQFAILQGAAATMVYQEDHTVTTNINGIAIVNIGAGNILNGDYNTIDWGSDDHFLNVQIDSGSGLVDLGTTQFMAVPYALYAESSGSGSSGTEPTGLEALDEGNGVGWRLAGRDPDDYDNIGDGAVDFSFGGNGSIGGHGASGFRSLAVGHWTTASGSMSTAIGYGSKASGNYSTAIGDNNLASGDHSFAICFNNEASGYGSAALGFQTEASGYASSAFGNNTIASGNSSFAMGYQTQANTIYSMAMGRQTIASGNNATVMGYLSEAQGSISTAMGHGTIASGTSATSLGYFSTASGGSSFAVGNQSQATASNSIAMGYFNVANQNYAVAIGESTTSSGISSVAMGAETTASGNSSFAMGDSNTAAGNSSVALGIITNATGDYSFAMGNNVNVSSFAAGAVGYNLINDDTRSFLVGQYNDNTTTASSLLMVGNGVSTSNRSNALEVLQNGKVLAPSLDLSEINEPKVLVTKEYLDTNYIEVGSAEAPSGLEAINEGNGVGRRLIDSNPDNYGNIGNYAVDLSTSDLASISYGATGSYSTAMGLRTTASGYGSTAMGIGTIADGQRQLVIGQYNNPLGTSILFQIGNGNAENSRSNAFVVFESGSALLAGPLEQNSDRRLKQDINGLDYGLNEIMKLKPVSYHWKKHPNQPKSLGLIAQDVQMIINEIVHVGEDKDQTLSISYIELVPVLIKAIQEQQTIIDNQKQVISNQEQTNEKQTEVLQALLERVEALEKQSKRISNIELAKN